MKSLIFIAPPAAGKGTQSEIISKKYNIPSISTGDLLRDARNQDNEIGRIIREKQDKGLLVDDEIVLNLLKNRLNEFVSVSDLDISDLKDNLLPIIKGVDTYCWSYIKKRERNRKNIKFQH